MNLNFARHISEVSLEKQFSNGHLCCINYISIFLEFDLWCETFVFEISNPIHSYTLQHCTRFAQNQNEWHAFVEKFPRSTEEWRFILGKDITLILNAFIISGLLAHFTKNMICCYVVNFSLFAKYVFFNLWFNNGSGRNEHSPK